MTRSDKLRLAAAVVLIIAFFTFLILLLSGVLYHGDGITPRNRTGVTRAAPVYSTYIGSADTKKFHLPTCSYLPDPQNQLTFASREDALAAGYAPCGHCHP
jgi:hypothetical protein